MSLGRVPSWASDFIARFKGKSVSLGDTIRIIEGVTEARRRERDEVGRGRESADDQIQQLLLAGFGLSEPPEEISLVRHFRDSMVDLHGETYFFDLLRRLNE